MRYGIYLTCGAAALIALALGGPRPSLVLLWPAAVLLWVAAGYFGLGGWVLFKRPDGRLPIGTQLLLGPFLWLTWLAWHGNRLLSREATANRITDRLWLGRRPLAQDLPPEVDLIVDLTGEFPLARGLPGTRAYRCLPTLDGAPPAPAGMSRLCDEILAWEGGVYVHCAAGHARSAALVALVLVRSGQAADLREAMRFIRERRRRAGINRAQRRSLEAILRS